jgi:hypothetical protein
VNRIGGDEPHLVDMRRQLEREYKGAVLLAEDTEIVTILQNVVSGEPGAVEAAIQQAARIQEMLPRHPERAAAVADVYITLSCDPSYAGLVGPGHPLIGVALATTAERDPDQAKVLHIKLTGGGTDDPPIAHLGRLVDSGDALMRAHVGEQLIRVAREDPDDPRVHDVSERLIASADAEGDSLEADHHALAMYDTVHASIGADAWRPLARCLRSSHAVIRDCAYERLGQLVEEARDGRAPEAHAMLRDLVREGRLDTEAADHVAVARRQIEAIIDEKIAGDEHRSAG